MWATLFGALFAAAVVAIVGAVLRRESRQPLDRPRDPLLFVHRKPMLDETDEAGAAVEVAPSVELTVVPALDLAVHFTAALEAADIPATYSPEFAENRLHTGAVAIRVRRDDYERAREVLAELDWI